MKVFKKSLIIISLVGASFGQASALEIFNKNTFSLPNISVKNIVEKFTPSKDGKAEEVKKEAEETLCDLNEKLQKAINTLASSTEVSKNKLFDVSENINIEFEERLAVIDANKNTDAIKKKEKIKQNDVNKVFSKSNLYYKNLDIYLDDANSLLGENCDIDNATSSKMLNAQFGAKSFSDNKSEKAKSLQDGKKVKNVKETSDEKTKDVKKDVLVEVEITKENIKEKIDEINQKISEEKTFRKKITQDLKTIVSGK